MAALPPEINLKPILSVIIEQEQDIVMGRQRARQLSAMLGFGQQDQARIATAVSEIARNAYQYAGGGRLDFSISLQSQPQFLWMEVSDHGPGIGDTQAVVSGSYSSSTGMGIGLAGTSRLMDGFQITSSLGRGTTVRFGKAIPAGTKPVNRKAIGELCSKLAQQKVSGAADELERQNRDLLQTLDTLRLRESELERRQEELARLNVELEETNRGVVALYAELDEKAVALQRADEMKSRFLSHVSHEFRTPVNSILALTRLLLNRTDGDLLPEQEKQIGYIRDATQHLAEMVNDLLDLAKVESGKSEVRITRVDVSQFFGATRALMRPLATHDAVALVFEEPQSELTVETDESKLGQILRNLISNSLKFTQQGEVRVSVELTPAQDGIVFTVQDTGIGIAPEDQERIFQEFAQIDNPIQRRVKGTGLGLPLSRKLTALLGGSLELKSEAGAGARFWLTLPYTASVRGDSPNRRSDTILIIDDEDTSRYLSHQLLRGTTYRLIEAVNGSEGAERARFESPALILLDLVMPDHSGFEILDELKSDQATREIPVVIQSSKELSESDYDRLGGRQAAILPKGVRNRRPAFEVIRRILGEPDLFSTEPEFSRKTTDSV